MKHAKHTKGPWTYDGTGTLLGDNRTVHLADLKTGHSDARLIAAAPEMLEQLELIAAYLEAKNIEFTGITEVIAKAKGGVVSAKHTKGPWAIIGDTGHGFIIQAQGPPVAHVMYSDNPTLNRPTGQVNAHLIAAAPELLEALEAMYQMYMVLLEKTDGRDDSIAFDARRAIAKAKGEL